MAGIIIIGASFYLISRFFKKETPEPENGISNGINGDKIPPEVEVSDGKGVKDDCFTA